jgi:hypothetical protein
MHVCILKFDGRKKTERLLQLRKETEADCVREGNFNEAVLSKDSSILDSLGSRRSLLVLVPKGRQENSRSREQDAKRDTQAHDGLGLEAVRLGRTSPVAQIEPGAHGVEVLAGALHEGVGRGGVDLVRGFVDDVAVQEGHGLSERHGAHDEGDQQQRVDGGHYEQAQVREGPVVADADHDVEGGDAGNAKGADEFFGGLDACRDDHLDEVGGYADDDHHGESLQDADEEEHLAQRHGAVAGDRHLGRVGKGGWLR